MVWYAEIRPIVRQTALLLPHNSRFPAKNTMDRQLGFRRNTKIYV